MTKNREVIVTTSWDDGHRLDTKISNLLDKYSLKGTFYVSPHNREFSKEDLLNEEEILSISNSHEIGAHTFTHPVLTKINEEEVYKEIYNSKIYLESLIGKKITSFCYPKGKYNKKHIKIINELGFSFARTTKRFCFVVNDGIEKNTTIHAYRHFSDILKILKFFGIKKFIKALLNWDYLAVLMFEKIQKEGGVFHLWGHSWEIEKNNDWERLEKVFKYISNKANIKYLTNSQV